MGGTRRATREVPSRRRGEESPARGEVVGTGRAGERPHNRLAARPGPRPPAPHKAPGLVPGSLRRSRGPRSGPAPRRAAASPPQLRRPPPAAPRGRGTHRQNAHAERRLQHARHLGGRSRTNSSAGGALTRAPPLPPPPGTASSRGAAPPSGLGGVRGGRSAAASRAANRPMPKLRCLPPARRRGACAIGSARGARARLHRPVAALTPPVQRALRRASLGLKQEGGFLPGWVDRWVFALTLLLKRSAS